MSGLVLFQLIVVVVMAVFAVVGIVGYNKTREEQHKDE